MAFIANDLMTKIAEPSKTSGNKVTVVGVGQVGMACAFSLLTQVNTHVMYILSDCG
jgi:L-lactate dehydrogenase